MRPVLTYGVNLGALTQRTEPIELVLRKLKGTHGKI